MGAQCASPCVSAAAVVVTARSASLQSSSSATSSLQPSPRRHSSSQEDPAYAFLTVSSLLQFPSLSVKAAEWLLTGVALCGAAMASEGTVAMSAMGGTRGGIDASEEVALAAGWCCVGGVVVALLIWFVQSRRLFFDTEKEHSIATPLFVPSNAHQGRCTFLKANGSWQPVTTVQRYGALFEPMRGTSFPSSSPSSSRAWWWRWVSVAVPVTVAGVTGAGGVSGGGCTASLSVCAVLLFSAGIAFAVARPYTLLSENVLNPIKYALLGATCVVLLVVREESEQSTPLTVIAALQTAVAVLRLVGKVLLRCLSGGATPNSHLAQEEGCARREGPPPASRDGVPLRYQPPPSTEPSASSQVPPPSDHVEPHQQQAEREAAYSPHHPHDTLAKEHALLEGALQALDGTEIATDDDTAGQLRRSLPPPPPPPPPAAAAASVVSANVPVTVFTSVAQPNHRRDDPNRHAPLTSVVDHNEPSPLFTAPEEATRTENYHRPVVLRPTPLYKAPPLEATRAVPLQQRQPAALPYTYQQQGQPLPSSSSSAVNLRDEDIDDLL